MRSIFVIYLLLLSPALFADCATHLEKGMHVSKLTVAAIQYGVRENQSEIEFFTAFRRWVETAKSKNAHLVVFPELIALDLLQSTSPLSESEQLRQMAKSFTPKFFAFVAALAKELDIAILAGSSPRDVNGRIFNTSFLAFNNGTSVEQDKIYLTPDEKDWGWTPGETLKVISAPWGLTSILICFDCEFPQLSERLVKAKPEVILVPSMTSDMSGLRRVQWSAQARAVEHYAYVVNTGTVTASPDRPYTGQASLLNPQEEGFPESIVRGPVNEESMVVGVLDMDKLRERRKTASIYPAREQMERKPPEIQPIDRF
jgi:deaminated glutathione amidase